MAAARLHLAAASILLVSCGGAPPPAPASTPSEATNAPASAGATKLDGSWEIVRYESDRPIPPEAMPLMGDMFDALRVRFEGGMARFEIGKTKEEVPFSVKEEESGFRLVAKGAMFDGAFFKPAGEGRYEVTDRKGAWPGVSVIARAR